MKNDLVQNIKDCGQSLIDNAERIAGNLPAYCTSLTMTCYPDKTDEHMYISVNYDFVPEGYINKTKEE